MRHLIWTIKFSLKELIYQKKVYLFLILNLFIGTFGFLAVQIFQNSLQMDLADRAQSMLGADFTISANRQFSPDELKKFEQLISYDQKSSLVEFFGMLKGKEKSRLVTVRSFDENYPFYGTIGSERAPLNPDSKSVWIDPELVKMLDVNLSQVDLKLGKLAVKEIDIITKDSSRFFRGTGFAPVVYISQKILPLTELVEPGSTTKTFLLYKLNNLSRLKEMQTEFFKDIKDTSIKFETSQDRAESSNSTFKYFTDYLGLVAIVSISLCFLSGGYLMRWAFQKQRKNIGIYKALGMSDLKIQWIYILQVLMTSMIAFILSLILFYFIKPVLNYYFVQNSLPFQLSLTATSVLICLGISVIAPLFMFMPINSSIAQLNPKDLFLGQTASVKTSLRIYVWYIICVIGFWGLAFYQSHSYQVATLFTGALTLIIVLLKYFLHTLFFLMRLHIGRLKLKWTTLYAIKSVINKKSAVDMVFITFTISILILTLLPHIKQSIVNEIRPTQTSTLPRLFLFDVQSGQKAELQTMSQKLLDAPLEFNPLVRSRILKVNDIDYDRLQNSDSLSTREQEEEVRFRNRGVNLTYQAELKNSELIVEGIWNRKKYDGTSLPEISLEKKYAERINAHLRDVILFDVQGLELQGLVTSIRTVKWTSFSPNFFILFQDGVLNEAPQNFLTAVSTLKDYDKFQNTVIEKFPNISIIDVRQTVKDLLVFVDQMALALQMMAIVSIILGFFIFIVLVNTQIQERLNEFNLLKVLGSESSVIRKIIFMQFFFIVSISLIVGLGLGLVLTQILVKFVFEIETSFDFKAMSIIALMLLPVVFLIVAKATRFLDRLSPIDLIRS